jgi:hypothetical protein
MLRELGIVIGANTKGATLFEQHCENFMEIEYDRPSKYVEILWNKYLASVNRNPKLNGIMFEYILASLCVREEILPLYLNAKVAFVPNVNYDLMIYTEERGPICLSVKTSLRERYKQADLEAIALKYVHRKSLSYLITLDENEARTVKEKISTGDVIGLDDVFIATDEEFDRLIQSLKNFQLEKPPTVKVIKSSNVVTHEKVKAVFPNS